MDQAAGLRKALGRSWAVVSGRGRVGKSNLTANLGYLLSRTGQQALLVDCDLGTTGLNNLLGLVPGFRLADVAAGRCQLSEAILTGPGGLWLVPGMSGVEGLQALDQAVRQRLFTDLSDRGRCCAITLLDCGAGISRSVLSFAAAAGAALVVTTPAPAALTDAYALIKGLHRLGVQLQLIVNRARPGTGQAAAARLQGVCARFLNLDLPVLGVIPEDEQVERAVVNGQLFMQAYPDCPAARALVKMATDISGQAVPQGSLWGRLGALLER